MSAKPFGPIVDLKRPSGKLGGRMSLTARKLQQEQLAEMKPPAGPKAPPSPAEEIGEAKRPFDPWLKMGGLRYGRPNPLAATAEWMIGDMGLARMMRAYEERAGVPRRRAMAEKDRQGLLRTVEAVLANLVYSAIHKDKPPAIAVSLRSTKIGNTRYDRPGFSNLAKVLEMFSSEKFVEPFPGSRHTIQPIWTLHKSKKKGTPSIVVGTDFFPSFVRYDMPFHGHSIADFYREPGFETIILARTERDYISDTRSRQWIDYEDTPRSHHFRQEMSTINDHLRSADISFQDDKGEPVAVQRKELRRFFSMLDGDPDEHPRFDQDGRLFDGWWQTLEKRRRGYIRVNGEPVADLDFSNMFLRLAYLDAGHEPPPGDLYASIPGLEEAYWRDGVKVLVNAMLYKTKPMVRLPRDKDLRSKLPPGAKGSAMRAAILDGHPLLRNTFETGVGYRLTFVESQILVAAMLRMIEAGITALPMHDGVMVPRSKHEEAAECLSFASFAITGRRLPISLKSLYE